MGTPWPCISGNCTSTTNGSPYGTSKFPLIDYTYASVGQDSGFFENDQEVVSSNSGPQSPEVCPFVPCSSSTSLEPQPLEHKAGVKRCIFEDARLVQVDGQEPVKKRQRGNCFISVKEIPSWNIYFCDRRRQIVKYSDKTSSIRRNMNINKRVSLCFYKNSLTKMNLDVVVSPTTDFYTVYSGVSKAVYEEAGRSLAEICKKLPRCVVGNVVITDGCNLPTRYIFHVNGPYAEPGFMEILQRCYEKCLSLLISNNLRTIGFPCISTGGKGVPKNIAAEIALKTVRRFLEVHFEHVYFPME